MRDPGRQKGLALAVMLAGLAAIGGAVVLINTADWPWTIALLLVAGVLATVGGFGGLMVFWSHPRLHRDLRAGRGILARWEVGAERWAQFRALEERLRAAGTAPRNELVLPPADPPMPLTVTVGPEAVLVGDDFHALEGGLPAIVRAETIFGPPLCIEIGIYYPPGGDSEDAFENVLRFPVGAGADAAAAKVLAHYRARVAAFRAANGIAAD